MTLVDHFYCSVQRVKWICKYIVKFDLFLHHTCFSFPGCLTNSVCIEAKPRAICLVSNITRYYISSLWVLSQICKRLGTGLDIFVIMYTQYTIYYHLIMSFLYKPQNVFTVGVTSLKWHNITWLCPHLAGPEAAMWASKWEQSWHPNHLRCAAISP